ncbi:MAG: hypothetical protein E7394_07420 [Ruminococcaceae bacterium]|nr:hypothetical protein [Oscillospiraceae bacterium]
MNWKRIKTFLIVLFLIINIYLLSTTSGSVIFRVPTVSKIEKETVQKTIDVISNNYGVNLNKNIVPLKFTNLVNIDVTNFIFTDVFQNSGFEFVQNSSDFECVIKTQTYSYTEDNAKEEITHILSKVGIDPSSYKINFKKSDHGLVCTVSEYVSGYPVFDGRIYAEFTSSTIKLRGNWYFTEQTEVKRYGNSDRLADITSVLIDCVSSISVNREGSYTIKDIGYGYIVEYYGDKVITKSASAIPCYMIETDFGGRYFYDAYNGNFIKQEE